MGSGEAIGHRGWLKESALRDYKKYEVFQLADGLVLKVYAATSVLPEDERYGLSSSFGARPCHLPSTS